MRILHIIARFNVGGTAAWLSQLSRELEAKGHENLVAIGHVQEPEIESPLIKQIRHVYIKGLGRTPRFLDDFRAFIDLRKLIRNYDPDIINTHTAKAGALGRLANMSLGTARKPLVHTVHGHLLTGYFSDFIVRLIIMSERLLAHFSDLLLFAGERVKNECNAVGIGNQENSVVVFPGVTVDEARKSRELLLRNYGLNSDRILVGWFARLTKIKRPDRLIEIARLLPELDFIVGGDGDLMEVSKLNAPHNVHFLGWVSPSEFWPVVDICLLTSDNEAMPISIIEAQLYGIPSVATDAGSTSEVVIEEENGFLVSNDIEKVASRVEQLALNSNLRRIMGEKARKRAEKVFSAQKQVDDHLMAYRKAILLCERNHE